MPLLNPVYAFVVPFLFVVTVPLAVFAGLTTTIAFSVLMLRVLAAYIDVALSLVPHYLSLGRKPRPYRPGRPPQLQRFASPVPTATTGTTALSSSSASSSTTPTPLRRRRRRRSSSALSTASLTPAASETALGLIPSIGPERDFEGVGGWRLGDDDNDVVDVWTTLNSRLELPDKQYHSSSSGRTHHHLLSPPSGPTTPGEPSSALYLMMKGRAPSPEVKRTSASPNSGRTRTPSGPRIAFSGKTLVDSYFPLFKSSSKVSRKCDI